MNDDLNEMVSSEKWAAIVSNYSELELARMYSFEQGIEIAYGMLYNDEWDEEIQRFAVLLLEEIQKAYPKEWNSSWIYNGFLGVAYDVILDYDNRYEALKTAMEMTGDPPPELLIYFAKCCDCPGDPPLSYDESICYLKKAMQNQLFIEGVGQMRMVYSLKGDSKNEETWKKLYEELSGSDKHVKEIKPPCLSKPC